MRLIPLLILIPLLFTAIACEEKPLVQRQQDASTTQPVTNEIDHPELHQHLKAMIRNEDFNYETAQASYQTLLELPVNRRYLFFVTMHLKNNQLAFDPDDPSESQPLSHLIHRMALQRIYPDQDWTNPEEPPTINPKLERRLTLAKFIEYYSYDIEVLREKRDSY